MKEQFRWLWQNIGKKRPIYVFAMCCTVVANIMQLIVPFFSQKIIDIFLAGENAAYNLSNNRKMFFMLVGGMVGMTFIRTIIVYVGNMSYESASQYMLFNMRNHLFKNIERQDVSYYEEYRTGDLMTRLTGDLDAIRHMSAWVVRMSIECVVLFLASTIYYFYLDPLMAVCLLALCPLIAVIMSQFRKRVAPLHNDLRDSLSKLNTATIENIAGNRVVKAFAAEEYEKKKFDECSRNYSRVNKKTAFMWLKFFPMVEGCAHGLSLIMMLAGGLFLINGRITTGEYIAFSGLIWTVATPMRNMGSVLNEYQRFETASKKVMEIYYAEPEMKEGEHSLNDEKLKGKVEFKNVSFTYEGDEHEVLHNVSFCINPGETVAVMGETGSGKTSLINMIPRFFDPTEGNILIDDMDVREYKYRDLRKNIGMATQDVLLYSDTIDGNIAYGDTSMSEKTVKVFAGVAAVTDFVNDMPDKFNTVVGERGVGLSGGQKQRIALARALAIKPSILILDDTTSAVDMETEKNIQENLKNLNFMCTKIIVAQRISTAKYADKIIILEHGRITECGTHDELVRKKDGYYRKVFELQNGTVDKEVAE